MGRYRTDVAVDVREGEWRASAACAGIADRDLDPWNPDDDMSSDDQAAAYDLAREVCAACPVVNECRAFGLLLLPLLGPESVGMYGGMTGRELAQHEKTRGRAARKVAQHGTRARRVAGCNCDDCKHAHAAYIADRRRRARGMVAA